MGFVPLVSVIVDRFSHNFAFFDEKMHIPDFIIVVGLSTDACTIRAEITPNVLILIFLRQRFDYYHRKLYFINDLRLLCSDWSRFSS